MATKKRRWTVAAGIGVPVVVFAAVYLLFFTPDSKEKLKLSANESGGAASTSSLEGRWSVAPGSQAGYRVREKLANLPAPSDAVGRTTAITGGFTVAGTGDSLAVRDTSFQADLTQLSSDQGKRDNRIRTMGLESDRFPNATFKATDPIEVPGEAIAGKPFQTKVTGDLTVHGVTKRVTIPVDVQRTGENVELAGSITFPFSEFGMQPPSVPPLVSVGDNATMEFKLLLARVPA
jgi:polyisoprenoid-binding protein YceI